ncbi:hypothetical protein Tco_1465228 [Tanacetum coccineum]
MSITRQGLSFAAIEQLIAQRVADAIVAYEANLNSGAVGLTKWFKKMESVFYICNCVENCQVKYATFTLLDGALTWELTSFGAPNVSKSWHCSVLEAIRMAHDLMDQVVRAKVEKDANNKRKWEDDQGGNSC